MAFDPELELPLSPLDAEYERLRREPSDIHEHLPTLRALAAEARVVVELGMRTGVSTVALAVGRPRALVSFDVDPAAIRATLERFERCGWHNENDPPEKSGEDPFLTGSDARSVELVLGSSLDVKPHPCDLLFVDTLHTETQLEAELQRWSPYVRQKIALHDTVTYGTVGEDGRNPGLMGAVRYWLALGQGQGRWRIKVHHRNNNGLLILERYAEEKNM